MFLEGKVNMVGELNFFCFKERFLFSYLLFFRIRVLEMFGVEYVIFVCRLVV